MSTICLLEMNSVTDIDCAALKRDHDFCQRHYWKFSEVWLLLQSRFRRIGPVVHSAILCQAPCSRACVRLHPLSRGNRKDQNALCGICICMQLYLFMYPCRPLQACSSTCWGPSLATHSTSSMCMQVQILYTSLAYYGVVQCSVQDDVALTSLLLSFFYNLL